MRSRIALAALLTGILVSPAFSEPCKAVMPLIGEKSSSFGSWHQGGRHSGTDIRAPRGTPVVAASGGVIVHSGSYYAYGVMVEIEHLDGSRARYAHLAKLAPGIRRGNAVEAGSLIGYVGRSGKATGYHLHLELRRDGRAVDPWGWINKVDCLQEAAADHEAP